MYAPVVTLSDVEIVNETDLALCCLLRGERHWLAPSRLLGGSTVHHTGDLGVLVLAQDFAAERGLIPSESRLPSR